VAGGSVPTSSLPPPLRPSAASEPNERAGTGLPKPGPADRPWRLNSATPSRASNCLIRVVTLLCTRFRRVAARTTPPSRTTA
jgi:hypothetical protein